MAKAKDKLRVGEQLLASGDYEDAVSRAYYAAFHCAQALLLWEGLSANTHQGVVSLFGLHFAKTGKLRKNLAAIFRISRKIANRVITMSIPVWTKLMPNKRFEKLRNLSPKPAGT